MTGRISVVGLGTGDWDRLGETTRNLLLDRSRRVIVRTLTHPAAQSLSDLRRITSADDLYLRSEAFEDVYGQLADLVVEAAQSGEDVVLAVPGSPWVGERTTSLVRRKAAEAGLSCEVMPGESFLEAAWALLDVDPLDRGFQILDGRDLPDPLPLELPTLIAQVDVPVVMGEVAGLLARLLPEETEVSVLTDLGNSDARVETVSVEELSSVAPGPRTTLYIDPPLHGWSGLVRTMRRLRSECPWDAKQTHQSLAPHIIEETYELLEAISALKDEEEPAVSGAFAELEEELGDVLLQVVFQTVIASEKGAFDIDDVTESLRRKLVRRHPHVYGTAEAGTAEEVYARWEKIKEEEKPPASSLMDRLPDGLPALQRADAVQRRAASVGFDWKGIEPVMAKVTEEAEELEAELDDPNRAEQELGDLLFAVVNLARHLRLDPELALRSAVGRFEARFRRMEGRADVSQLGLDELDRIWELVKLEPDA